MRDQSMNSLNNTKSEEHKSICDGFGCSQEATTQIDEKIGEMGRIVLDLCDECLMEFREQ